MIPSPVGSPPDDIGALTHLAHSASEIGFGIAELAGLLDRIEFAAGQQAETMDRVEAMAGRIVEANGSVGHAIGTVSESCLDAEQQVESSVSDLRLAGERTRKIAGWVKLVGGKMAAVDSTLGDVKTSNSEIASIAKQVNILAINAKIEASRAGDAGRGFAVVADAINHLSQQTTQAAQSISDSIAALAGVITALRDEAEGISEQAGAIVRDAEQTDATLSEIAQGVQRSARSAEDVNRQVEEVGQVVAGFGPAFGGIVAGVRETSQGITDGRARVHGLVDLSEAIVQGSVQLGGEAADMRFITHSQDAASEIGLLFERAIEDGQISESELFNQTYRPVPGTDPQQVVAPFTRLTDRILPPIQEAALELDKSVVFCAAVDRNGYLPTHNRKFSHPQGRDPVWNAANCRNRRVFDDRVGLKAGQNTAPFLVQIYRRDMGGGQFVPMKDASAPIFVRGRHWGGLRLAYTV